MRSLLSNRLDMHAVATCWLGVGFLVSLLFIIAWPQDFIAWIALKYGVYTIMRIWDDTLEEGR